MCRKIGEASVFVDAHRFKILPVALSMTMFLTPDTHITTHYTMRRDSDGDSVDSADFFDTVARKPVTKVKLGESKRGTLNSSISGSRYVGG